MPEQIKRYISVEDLKLLAVIVSVLLTMFLAWGELQEEVVQLQTKSNYDTKVMEEQVEAIQELTRAVQDLNVTSAQLEVRLRNLERIYPELRRSID